MDINECLIENEYSRKYTELIRNAHYEDGVYTQKHHIIPKNYFKHRGIDIDNSESNLVRLSYKDHILAHYYLYKCAVRDDDKLGNLYALLLMLKNIGIHHKQCDIDEVINCLSDVNKLYSEYRDMLSKIASERVGELNSFFGRKHNDVTRLTIGTKNSKQVTMIVDDIETVFPSMKAAINYLQSIGITATMRPIVRASKNDTEVFGAKWIIHDNGHAKQTFSEESRQKLIENARKRGTHLRMTNIATNETIEFNSRNSAGIYIKDHGLDKMHPKNIGKKIYDAAISGDILYNCKWEIIKL